MNYLTNQKHVNKYYENNDILFIYLQYTENYIYFKNTIATKK